MGGILISAFHFYFIVNFFYLLMGNFFSHKSASLYFRLVLPVLILFIPTLIFVLILSNPQGRSSDASKASKDSLKGEHSYTLQSRENLKFANATSLVVGIKGYYKAWPPAYPIFLYVFNKVNISPILFNLMIYLLNMAWFYYYLKKIDLGVSVTCLIFFSYAMGCFHYHNLAVQIVSEGLFVLVAQLIFTLVIRYSRDNNFQTIVCLAVLTSFLVLTRYFGLLWIYPIVMICILIFSNDNITKFKHITVYGVMAILPTLPWFIWLYGKTGYFTGFDRSHDRGIRHLTDFTHNVFFTLKTYYVDFFSLDWASHINISRRFHFHIFDLFLMLMLSIVFLSICMMSRNIIKQRVPHTWEEIRGFFRDEHLLFLLLLFSGFYLVVLITVWTAGNNDPIYTRFLYPSYPFIILTIVKIFDLIKKYSYHQNGSYLLTAFFLMISASQVCKAVILFKRYLIAW